MTSVQETNLPPPPSKPLSQQDSSYRGQFRKRSLPPVPINNGHKKRGRDDRDQHTQPRGPTTTRTMENPRKAYAKEVLQIVGRSSKKAKVETIISFNDDDLEGIKFPHDDPLVIMPVIGNSPVKRVLVDGGASGRYLVLRRLHPDGIQRHSFNSI